MTSLREHAKGGGAPDVVLVRDQPQRPPVEIVDDELIHADDLTAEGEFPEYGQFLWVETVDGNEEYWETPAALAEVVVATAEEEEQDVTQLGLAVDEVVKTATGEWRYSLRCGPTDGWSAFSDE